MKKSITTERAPSAVGPYSQAVEINGMLFVSGQIPLDPVTGTIVEGGIREQTKQVLDNMGAILEEADYSFKHVVKCTCLLSDMADFRAMNEVYNAYFPDDPPARAAFAVRELPLGVRIEIDAVAVKED